MTAFYVLFGLALYLLPTIIAILRRAKANVWQVAIINVAFGWTFVGWVIALVLAASNKGHNPSLVVSQNITLNSTPEDPK
jgi:uncharacterized membrane protein